MSSNISFDIMSKNRSAYTSLQVSMLFQLVSTIRDRERRFSQSETVSIRMTSFVCPCVFLLTFSDDEDGNVERDDEANSIFPPEQKTCIETERRRERERERERKSDVFCFSYAFDKYWRAGG